MILGAIQNVLQSKKPTGGGGSGDTTPDKKQVFLIIGDSNAGDTSAAVTLGPTTPAGSTYVWNGSSITELTTQDLSNAGAIYGTAYKKLSLDRYNNTGFKSIFVNRASSGSEYITNGDTNNWSTTGALYTPAVQSAQACLANQLLTKLKGIIVVLGTNDVREGTLSITDIKTGMESLYARLQADFPDTPIYVVNTGMYNGANITQDARKWGMMKNLMDIVNANPNIKLVTSMFELYQWGYGFGDSLHLTTAGYNKIGEILARNIQATETNKDVNRIVLGFHDALSYTHSAAWKAFIEAEQAAGRWFAVLDALQIYVGTSKNNIMRDMSGLTVPVDSGFDFVANNYIASDAVAIKYLRTNFVASVGQINTGVSDFLEGFKTVINSSTAPGTVMGISSGFGSLRRIFQNNSILFNAHSASTTTYATDTVVQNNTRYILSRGGGTQYMYKNNVIASQANTTASVVASRDSYLGGNGSAGSYVTCQYRYYYYMKRTDVDIAAFENNLEILLTALQS